MTLHKNKDRGHCFIKLALKPFMEPLLKAWGVEFSEKAIECDPDCVLYRRGMRYWEKENRSEPFEECAVNIIADSAESQVQRTFAMQKEMGETKNAVLFQAISSFTDNLEDKQALGKMIQKAGGLNKLIGKVGNNGKSENQKES